MGYTLRENGAISFDGEPSDEERAEAEKASADQMKKAEEEAAAGESTEPKAKKAKRESAAHGGARVPRETGTDVG